MCYQLVHPEAQTPCFIKAGKKPCSEKGCPVYDAITVSTLTRKLGTNGFRAYIENNLLHHVCPIISKFAPNNSEYRERTGYKS